MFVVICIFVFYTVEDEKKQRHVKSNVKTIVNTDKSVTNDSSIFNDNHDENDKSKTTVSVRQQQKSTLEYKTTAVQTTNQILYRLRLFPTLKDVNYDGKSTFFICRCLRFFGRLALCQFGEYKIFYNVFEKKK